MADDLAEDLTLEELEVAIASLRNSLESMSRDDADFYSTTTLLAHALRKLYLLSRSHEGLSALEESITILQQAIDSSSVGDGRRAEWLISLAFGLSLRCDATESESDAIEASRVAYGAVDAVEKDDPSYATILQSACHFIGKKAIRLHDEDDLDKMFEMHKSILAVTPVDHPKLKSRLRSYDDTTFKLYLSFGQKDALEEAIRASEYIINIPDQSSEEHARNVWILAQRLVQRYLRTGTSADLDDSIRACQQAVDDTPISSKNRQRRLQSLCDRLGEKYSQTLEEADFQAAKVREASKLLGLGTETASLALEVGKSAATALEFLEMARGVMASSINVLRADIKDLERYFPELAGRYKHLRDQLDTGSAPKSDFALGEEVWENEMSQRYDTREQISALLEEIRSKPGFENFARPEDEERMRSAAALGPVIVVNVGPLACDAIIIQQDGFSAIPLPRLDKNDIDSKYQPLGRGSLKVLEWLWDVVAEPILTALGFTEPPHSGEMKRGGTVNETARR
ncbi:hypothetical protein FOXG_12051 [Fusarium oxysporum f. sp. lycopersici 4287]|uniref:Uncharacterized protein n=2 Tax=Fusarium oxysporum TaxID=5507 RepID=A0A0J9WRF8_FUSO4|nr:hypothetical protein FOXG_12051 [Fusarium oxysporum f. sp. lycopersici 4287]KNB12457.1 hypothetical protein FOXG_12051 [Fusarium oxysporum f. sp. lycopersici 4287]